MKTYLSLIVILLIEFITLKSEERTDDWKLTGSIQIRSELDGRDFSNKTYPYSFTGLRLRVGVEKSLFNTVSFFAQFQDSRVYGEEPSLTSSTKNIDLHQGYAIISNILDLPLSVKAGRFEMAYGSGRIIQSSQWSYIGGSFDGLVAGYKTDLFGIDAFAITTVYSIQMLSNALPDTNQYPYPSKPDQGMNVWGFWGNANILKEHKINVFTYYEFNGKKSDTSNYDLMRYTSGLSYEFNLGNFTTNIEFGYQFGKGNFVVGTNPPKYTYTLKGTSDTTFKIFKDSTVSDKYGNLNIASFMAFLGVKYKMSPLIISINADILSGTKFNTTNEINLFASDYASKHTFFGYMDYFSNLERSTKKRGINDYFLRFEYLPVESKLNAQLDAHYFTTNVSYLMPNKSENSNLGQEFDLVLKYKALNNSTIEWGGSIFLPGDVMKDIYKIKKNNVIFNRDDLSFWTYLMLRVNI